MPSRMGRRSSTHHSSVAPGEEDETASAVALGDVSMMSSVHGGTGGLVTPAEPHQDDAKYALASSFLATMMREVILDHALAIHRQVWRKQRAQGVLPGGCAVCKTTCQAPHEAQAASTAAATTSSLTDTATDGAATTVKEEAPEEGALGGEAITQPSTTLASSSVVGPPPKGLEIYHNNPLLACLVCSRQVSANRYALHLASCVGVGKGSMARTNRKGKNPGLAKIKTALENRKRKTFPMSGASTPIPMRSAAAEDTSSSLVLSDDDGALRKPTTTTKSNLSSSFTLNGNGKRMASPGSEGPEGKKSRMEGSPSRNGHEISARNHPLLGVSALASSQPATGSPLNPHRSAKVITIDSDEEEEEGMVTMEGDEDDDEVEMVVSTASKIRSKLLDSDAVRSSSVVTGGGDDEDGSDFVVDNESGSDANGSDDDDSYVQAKDGGGDQSDSGSEASENGDESD